MKKKLVFVCLLRTISKQQMMWGKYTIAEGDKKGQERKAIVLDNGEVMFLSSKLTQQDVRDKYDLLAVSKIDEQKVVHMPGITGDEAF